MAKKLVRDKIPEITQAEGEDREYYIAGDEEYLNFLLKKFLEESNELILAQNDEKLKEELGDVLELVFTLCKFKGIDFEEIQKLSQQKRLRKGGFEKKIIGDF